jgi:uncharacterized membrane protein
MHGQGAAAYSRLPQYWRKSHTGPTGTHPYLKGNPMEALIPLIVLAVIIVPLGLVIWLIARAVQARDRIEELSRRLSGLEVEVYRLKKTPADARAAWATTSPAAAPAKQPAEEIFERPPAVAPAQSVPPPVVPEPEPMAEVIPQMQETVLPPPILPVEETFAAPPPFQTAPGKPAAAWSLGKSAPAINWEQFMGVKLFAWIGGLALFLGVAFFVKYSFDNNLISPELRVAIGFAAGLGLLVGGIVMSRRNYPALSQTLCATGVVILYAVTFACRSIYHFEFFGPIPTFLLMVLITTTAFFLAVRLNALVIAILGMLGGFLTPVLLSTGVDNPLGLFGYIAILDAGLIFVALNRRWFFLTALAALGTAIMQIGWAGKFFEAEKYFEGNKICVALAVLLGFNALYLAGSWWGRRREKADFWLSGSALGLVAVALVFTAWFLDFAPLAQRPWLMFGFVFLIDLMVAALVLLDEKISPAQSIAGLAVFGLLAFWTGKSLSNELLNPALVFYFVFAIFHSLLPTLFKRQRGAVGQTWPGHFFPIIALALVLVPIFKLAEVSFIVWPFILLVDVLAIILAVLTATLLPVLAVLLLTLAATGALIFKIPAELTGMPTSFFLLGAFAVFFVAVSAWLARKFKPDAFQGGIKFGNDITAPQDLAAVLPACSATLPFLLLIMATLRLHLVNPSPVFGLALLLVVLMLGVTKMFSLDWMPAIGLACVTALECAWHFNRFDPANPNQPLNLVLAWYLIFFAVFSLFPFVFLKKFRDKVIPWAIAALAGLPQFFLIYRYVKVVHPNEVMGLLPAAFAVPALLSLVVVLKKIPAETKSRMTQLAFFGGVALFFITLIFPIQFDRQWITIGWALEGAALLWLFHRVPHPGLRLTGIGLLIAAFVRLAFNPAVLDYHQRSATPIFNWYLYSYGIVTACLFLGARLLAPPRNLVLRSNVPPILAGLGTVLAFLLMNIEIADYFSPAGSTLTFQFRDNFARDMTYTIAWALFALVLLVIGIVRKIPASRYAAMGLLCVTLLKLFFHDLARLDQLYRIGAFIAVAVIAMVASFAYQRFFTAILKEKESKDETVQ